MLPKIIMNGFFGVPYWLNVYFWWLNMCYGKCFYNLDEKIFVFICKFGFLTQLINMLYENILVFLNNKILVCYIITILLFFHRPSIWNWFWKRLLIPIWMKYKKIQIKNVVVNLLQYLRSEFIKDVKSLDSDILSLQFPHIRYFFFFLKFIHSLSSTVVNSKQILKIIKFLSSIFPFFFPGLCNL
jgi:hypothetical protein